MNWLSGLSDQDKKEMIEDACSAYHSLQISSFELRLQLAKLGCNATDIEGKIREYKP